MSPGLVGQFLYPVCHPESYLLVYLPVLMHISNQRLNLIKTHISINSKPFFLSFEELIFSFLFCRNALNTCFFLSLTTKQIYR